MPVVFLSMDTADSDHKGQRAEEEILERISIAPSMRRRFKMRIYFQSLKECEMFEIDRKPLVAVCEPGYMVEQERVPYRMGVVLRNKHRL